ncbi:MAG: pantoate--beta-alanine ligase [Anaerolineales bacterium]|nr:pantoate--beta-alanine ligase [Anaerolineales bacterium]
MILTSTLNELREARSGLLNPVGLVPTMGFLHEGHISLVRCAKGENESVVVSIYVNPTQFAPTEDLKAYPRNTERDLALLENEGVDLVWSPSDQDMYPPGFQTWVELERLTKFLEGSYRPEHFRGVATVVSKLFNAVQPQRAYFGQKDAQQAVVITRMTQDLNFPVEVIICPTIREADGLALSSRNSYLNPEERRGAPVLYRALSGAKEAFESGIIDSEELHTHMLEVLENEPLAEVEYVSVADLETLEELDGPITRGLLSMAVRFRTTRLIDNMIVGVDH